MKVISKLFVSILLFTSLSLTSCESGPQDGKANKDAETPFTKNTPNTDSTEGGSGNKSK